MKIFDFLKSFNNITVFALVGLSGTGKSFRAKLLADKCSLEAIIDDGLLIQNDKILGIASSLQVTPESNLFQMLMQAKASQLKVELGVVFNTESIMIHTVKLI